MQFQLIFSKSETAVKYSSQFKHIEKKKKKTALKNPEKVMFFVDNFLHPTQFYELPFPTKQGNFMNVLSFLLGTSSFCHYNSSIDHILKPLSILILFKKGTYGLQFCNCSLSNIQKWKISQNLTFFFFQILI